MHSATKFMVWDWNGTLIEDLPLNVACFNATLAHVGKPGIDIERYQETFEIPIGLFYCKNGFSEEEYATTHGSFQHIFHDNYNEGIKTVGFRKGVEDVLLTTQAKGIRHIILSNHLTPSIDEHLTMLNARHFFWDILAHENREVQMGWTPKGDRLTNFMQSHGLCAENGFTVGDTPEETQIARQIGLTSIAITGGFASEARLREAQPDFLITDISHIAPILSARGFAL